MIVEGKKIGRVCPVVRQQCQLKRGCAMFDGEPPKAPTIDEKARAHVCYRRGVYVFADELAERRFRVEKHDLEHRDRAGVGARRRLLTMIGKRDQLRLWPDNNESAAEAVAGVGARDP